MLRALKYIWNKGNLSDNRGDGLGALIATILLIILVISLIAGPFKNLKNSAKNAINTGNDMIIDLNDAMAP